MKKIFLLLVTICCVSEGFAQQTPLYSQYFDNPLIYNPAYAGLDRFGSVNLSWRNQWTGITADSDISSPNNSNPETTLFSVDIPVYNFTSGVGLQLMSDDIGFLSNYKLTGSYAYHHIGKYVDSSVLSFGISIGYNHIRSMLSENPEDYNYIRHSGDPKLEAFNQGSAFNSLDFSFGVNYMYKDKFQVGISAPQLVNQGIRAVDNDPAEHKIQLDPNLLLSLKCTLKTYDELHYVEPQAMVRWMANMPLQFDAGLQYTYNQLFWVNAMYRHGGQGQVIKIESATDTTSTATVLAQPKQGNFSVLFAMGLKLQRYRIGIASDFTTGQFSRATGSTFELVFGYKFGHLGQQKYPSPAGRNSKIRFKKRHPSIPGPLNKKLFMGSPKKFRGRKN